MALNKIDPTMLGFRGACATRTTQGSGLFTHATFSEIAWEDTVWDTDNFWDIANPNRLTVPSGVNWMAFQANITLSSAVSYFIVYLLKNTDTVSQVPSYGGATIAFQQDYSQDTYNMLSVPRTVIPVVAGDYFRLSILQYNTLSANVSFGPYPNIIWFKCEVVG